MIEVEKKGEGKKGSEAEEVKEILGAVSAQVPALIKGIIGSVFSEEAGRDMGKAAGAFYKELKESGIPDDVAVEMTENYIGMFTSLGDVLKQAVGGKGKHVKISKLRKESEEGTGADMAQRIKEKMAETEEEE